MRKLTRVWSVTDQAMLPFLVIHEESLETEGLMDVPEAEFDIMLLGGG